MLLGERVASPHIFPPCWRAHKCTLPLLCKAPLPIDSLEQPSGVRVNEVSHVRSRLEEDSPHHLLRARGEAVEKKRTLGGCFSVTLGWTINGPGSTPIPKETTERFGYSYGAVVNYVRADVFPVLHTARHTRRDLWPLTHVAHVSESRVLASSKMTTRDVGRVVTGHSRNPTRPVHAPLAPLEEVTPSLRVPRRTVRASTHLPHSPIHCSIITTNKYSWLPSHTQHGRRSRCFARAHAHTQHATHTDPESATAVGPLLLHQSLDSRLAMPGAQWRLAGRRQEGSLLFLR